MKSTLAVAVISFASLFALFHPCHGIICYSCRSRNYADKGCETISGDEHAFDYEDSANICIRMVVYANSSNVKGTTNRLLHRYGHMEFILPTVLHEIKIQRIKGQQVEFDSCQTNRCNND